MKENDLSKLNAVFTTAEARAAGISYYKLRKYETTGELIREEPSIWSNVNLFYDSKLVLQAKYSSAIVSGKSALIWWRLIDAHETTLTVTLPYGMHVATKVRGYQVRVRHVVESLYKIGLTTVQTADGGGTLKIYDPERALIDGWRFSDELNDYDRRESVYNYLQSDYRNINKLTHYLNHFRGLKDLRLLLEVLSN